MRLVAPRMALAVAALVAASLVAMAQPSSAQPVPGSGCTLFPADNAWHADVRSLPVHPRSDQWLANMGGSSRRLHPDFGPNDEGAQPYGIPYAVVGADQPKVDVAFEYEDESDRGPYPFGPQIPVEGGSDRHALVVDRDACRLYELYAVEQDGDQVRAGSGAVWDLRSNDLRPAGWTSADAAGLPILPGLLRRDEVLAGEVDHAIRMTAARTDRAYLWPARHQAGAAADPALPPMGARFRLKGDFDLSRFRPDTQVVLRAMQKHGMVLADNGSNWYFTGTSEHGWDTAMLDELKSITAGSFEAVDFSSLQAGADSGRVAGAAPAPAVPPAPSPATTTTRPRPATTSTATTAPPTPSPMNSPTIPPAASPTIPAAASPATSTAAPTSTTGPAAGGEALGADAETARQSRTVPRVLAGAVAGIAACVLVARRRRVADRG